MSAVCYMPSTYQTSWDWPDNSEKKNQKGIIKRCVQMHVVAMLQSRDLLSIFFIHLM